MSADSDTTPRRFYKTTIALTVLSEEPIPEGMELADMIREADEGEYVLNEEAREQSALCGGPIAAELRRAGSEPAFFGLDRDGAPLEDDLDPIEQDPMAAQRRGL